jgi:ribosomal protein S18 acetylase RimI-like enzyme
VSNTDIVRLTRDNVSLLDHVAVDVFDEPVAPHRLAAYVAEPGHFMFVAVADGVVVGQCAAVIHRHPDKVTELYIDEVGVSPAFHRRGIARRMLDAMFALGRDLGCGEAWVGTEVDNTPARRLYEQRGAEGETFVMYEYEL